MKQERTWKEIEQKQLLQIQVHSHKTEGLEDKAFFNSKNKRQPDKKPERKDEQWVFTAPQREVLC